MSALLFALFFPGIIEQGAATYLQATGQTQQPFLTRWLLITAFMFLTSGALYLLRVAIAVVRARVARPGA